MLWSPLGTFLVHLFTSGIRLHHLPLTCPPLTAAICLVCLLFWEFLFLLHFFFFPQWCSCLHLTPPTGGMGTTSGTWGWSCFWVRWPALIRTIEVNLSWQLPEQGWSPSCQDWDLGWTISTSLASCELAPASKRDGGDEAMMDRSCLVTLKVFRMLLCFQALSLAGKALLHQATCTKTCSSVSPLVAPFNRIFHSWAVSGTISWVVDAAVQ